MIRNQNDKKHKILIVDDEQNLREMLEILLKREGYEVLQAENGEIGFSIAQEFLPDLIISDIKMPKMTGIELLHQLRELNIHVAVVMMTALLQQKKLLKQ